MPAHSPPRPQNNQIGMPSAWDLGISVLSRLPGNWMFGVSRWYYLSGLLDIRFQGPPWRFWFTKSVWGTALESTSHTGAPGGFLQRDLRNVPILLRWITNSLFQQGWSNRTFDFSFGTSILYNQLQSSPCFPKEREGTHLTWCYIAVRITALCGHDCWRLTSVPDRTNPLSHSLSTVRKVLSAP